MHDGAGRLQGRANSGAYATRRGGARPLAAVLVAVLAISSVFAFVPRPEIPISFGRLVDRAGLPIAPAATEAPQPRPEPSRPVSGVVAAPAPEPTELPPTPAPGPFVEPAKRTALIIGIDNARGGRPLYGSITDARNLQTALSLYGFLDENVTVLLDKEATRASILQHLDELALRTPSDGLAVFAVATHTRRRGGINELLTADGRRINAHELADRLGAVQAPMWVALPTCYAGGYALPGIVGPGRLAVFASAADRETYQVGSAGSYLFIEMVREAMVEGKAPDTVQDAFHYAERELRRSAPGRVPIMSDGIGQDLVLGEWSGVRPEEAEGSVEAHEAGPAPPSGVLRNYPPRVTPAPSPTPTPSRGGLRVCGKVSLNCRR